MHTMNETIAACGNVALLAALNQNGAGLIDETDRERAGCVTIETDLDVLTFVLAWPHTIADRARRKATAADRQANADAFSQAAAMIASDQWQETLADAMRELQAAPIAAPSSKYGIG